MGEMFKKENCLTVPNLLSLFRICLIPWIPWFYCRENAPLAAAAVIGLSGLTDVADGYIARRWNQVSDLGKILDPVADKLTQMTMLLCLLCRYAALWSLTLIFLVKELGLWLLGALAVCKTGDIRSARWFGKVNTVVLYSILLLLLLLPGIPEQTVEVLTGLCAAVMLMSFFLYARQHLSVLLGGHKKAA